MSEALRFYKAALPSTSSLCDGSLSKMDTTKISKHFWCRDKKDKCTSCFCELPWDDDFFFPSPSEAVDIVPELLLENLSVTDFNIGEAFTVKGIPFKIISSDTAIALMPIGTYAWEDSISKNHSYDCSELKELLDDWFDCFIVNESVMKINIIDIYDIQPMPGHLGRFHIVNKNGKVRHNASGHGFTSPQKALNMLKYYAATIPIPQEDMDAYQKYNDSFDDVSFPKVYSF